MGGNAAEPGRTSSLEPATAVGQSDDDSGRNRSSYDQLSPLSLEHPKTLRSAAKVPVQGAMTQWSDAMATGRSRHPLMSLLDDWHEFSGQDYRTMLEQMVLADERIESEWETVKDDDASAVTAFYENTPSLLPVLAWWHGTQSNPARAAACAASVLEHVGARRVMDYGSGIGSTSLLLAAKGIEVLMAEVADTSLEFATWRLHKRGHQPAAIDITSHPLSDLPSNCIQGVVSFDVFEHLPEPSRVLEELDRLLVDGGLVCLNQIWIPPEEEHAGHYRLRGEPLEWLSGHGYRLAHVRDVMWIAQKAHLSPQARIRQGSVLQLRIAAARAALGARRGLLRTLGFHIQRIVIT